MHAEGERGVTTLHFEQREHLDVLGVRLDSTGSTEASISTKLASAKRGVFADLEAWRNKGSRVAKVEAFARQVHARVLHGSRTWVLTDKALHLLRKWENEVMGLTGDSTDKAAWRRVGNTVGVPYKGGERNCSVV